MEDRSLMNPSLLLKIGAIILFVYSTGHTFGAVVFYRAHSPEEAAIIDSMKDYHVPLKVSSARTLWDFFYGFGLAVGFLNYALAAIAWIAARQAGQACPFVGHISLVLAAACLSQTYLSWRYFFMMPLLLSSVAALAFIGAYFLISTGITPAHGT
jgi:hypothetical protein